MSSELVFHPHQPINHGLKEDVQNLIAQTLELFDEHEELRITHFQTVWKNTKFGLVSLIINMIFIHKYSDATNTFIHPRSYTSGR